jgi:hypothetical protein
MLKIWFDSLVDNFSSETVYRYKREILPYLEKCEFRRHPLGFIHASLIDTDYATLRFHLWKPGMRSVQEPAWLIHTHTFELRSIVLSGKLVNRLYSWHEAHPTPINDFMR